MDTIRLIASDLDATLLDGQSQLPPDFAETVRALAEQGIRFAAASGRPIYTLEEMFAPLRDDIILVGDNGGAICWKGESLYLSEMDVADWHTLAGQARSAGHAAVLCGLETAYVEEQFRPYDRVFKRFYTKVEYVPHLEDVTARVDKFTIYFPEGDAQKGYDALYGPVWGGRFSVAVAGADWVDIMNPGVHKGAAVRALAPAILGMDVELPETDEYVAIGAARQAAWVLSGETEPPTWPVKVETTLTGEPTPQVYEQYVRWRG